MKTPELSTAAAFPRYLMGEVVADSVALQWQGLFARRWRLPRVVDRLLVPATPEPHISCKLGGLAEFKERDVGGAWVTRQIRAGEMFVTRFRTPYEVRFQSPPGQQLDNLSLHIAVEPFQKWEMGSKWGRSRVRSLYNSILGIRVADTNKLLSFAVFYCNIFPASVKLPKHLNSARSRGERTDSHNNSGRSGFLVRTDDSA